MPNSFGIVTEKPKREKSKVDLRTEAQKVASERSAKEVYQARQQAEWDKAVKEETRRRRREARQR